MTASIGRAVAGWTQLQIVTTPQFSEACAALLWEVACEGVWIDDSAVLLDQSEDAVIAPTAQVTVTGYLADAARAEEAVLRVGEALNDGAIDGQLRVAPVADQDWASSWRDNFPPLAIGRFLIAPPWEQVEAVGGAIVVRIDPGLAFGTGQHPTTHMCLELLGERLAGLPTTLLDVGCGSGILSIAAARLGAHVTGSDLDAFCVSATADNARDNGVSVQVVRAAGLDWTTARFDVVVANLMSALLIGLAPGLAAVARPGGTLIVSGISAPRAADVEHALHEAGFTTLERRDRDGDIRGDFTEQWVAFVMNRADS